MSKHRLREDDDTTLLPPTVEELARSEHRGTRSRSGRQPVIIALATAALLVSGAAAWALVKPSADPSLEFPMTGPSAPGGAGFVDGFGVVTPSPLPTLKAQPSGAPSAPTSPTTAASPSVGATASGAPLVSLSPSSAAGVEAPGAGNPGGGGTTTALAATYSLDPWWRGFTLEVTVRNNGSASADWRVRVQFPAGTDNQNWAVWSTVATTAPDNVWVFAPLYGKLAPGTSVKFGMTGLRAGTGDDFTLLSCTVEGGSCTGS
ncbi:cellulose binding domain-containing protein [Catellatospora tritici]|uniref:cellulose binding domain-containing protein n=1 Tax=Catellatospora tritici TaxID=2851566 RepID=UPI001C2CFEFD|nr:cellulose binding domain-containing protein [Catellatospora tritici]MBV1849453.1 cellulose-binding domain-containing protein [Catellatospora tritici]MBV1854025.1 cellulose-binding domain-containing protein [Catellatospora tritici]